MPGIRKEGSLTSNKLFEQEGEVVKTVFDKTEMVTTESLNNME